jgi:gluconate 2-dehydrogenase gamma chain
MTDDDVRWRPLSRRELLKRIGGASAAAAVPARLFLPMLPAQALAAEPGQGGAASAGAPSAPETLTGAELATLEAITGRLIPADASGPGAIEARAARYIDRALGGALAASREAYRSGLAALDRHAQTSKGAPFLKLSPADQDAVLGDLERNVGTGFTPGAAAFFGLVLSHTIQGTFCDPHYGGNVNFAGWDLIGYPGVRIAVSADDQRLGGRPAPTHKSAYDYPMFSGKRPARASVDHKGRHDAE